MASSLEGNKIAAALLVAGIMVVGSGVLSSILYAPYFPHERAFTVAVTEPGPVEEPAPVAPIEVRLAAADPAKGQGAAKTCAACHNFVQGGANKVGPNLWEVVGAPIGSHADGFAYSAALVEKGGAWDFAALDGFLESPKAWAPGTKMSYVGIADPAQRADVIAYLRSLAATPVPLPAAQ